MQAASVSCASNRWRRTNETDTQPPRAVLLALHMLAMGALAAPAPVLAMQILDAADHAELTAQISAAQVSRIALAADRIAKVVRAPNGFAVEHDARSGDLYLKPLTAGPAAHDPSPCSSAPKRASPTG